VRRFATTFVSAIVLFAAVLLGWFALHLYLAALV